MIDNPFIPIFILLVIMVLAAIATRAFVNR
jgi:hypothetical protein